MLLEREYSLVNFGNGQVNTGHATVKKVTFHLNQMPDGRTMRRSARMMAPRAATQQGGFTLVEMIVVVGIIAVLAAAIAPCFLRYIGTGEQGAMDAEAVNIQIALEGMMAGEAITIIDAHDSGSSSIATQSWTALPVGLDAVPLSGYLQAGTTVYFYCYDDNGDVTEQFETGAACTT